MYDCRSSAREIARAVIRPEWIQQVIDLRFLSVILVNTPMPLVSLSRVFQRCQIQRWCPRLSSAWRGTLLLPGLLRGTGDAGTLAGVLASGETVLGTLWPVERVTDGSTTTASPWGAPGLRRLALHPDATRRQEEEKRSAEMRIAGINCSST